MKLFTASILGAAAALCASAQTTVTDNFNVAHDYLTAGVAGTIWDGVFFGAGEFNNTGVGGGGPGQTLQCNANISAANTLTLQTTGTAWENADDDGFFLFKVVRGDFSAIVKIVTPFNNAGYNTAGLQARAFGAGGDAFGGKENYVSWTRFDEYGYANYLRNEVNGIVSQINPGDSPNTAYWLRMDRIGNTFRFYQRTNSTDAWKVESFPAPVNGTNLARADLAGQSLEVGIMHATFAGQLGVQFSNFSITETNMGPFATAPSPATGLTMTTNSSGNLALSWSAGAGSSGSVVVVWTATNSLVKEMPANGFTYTANPGYGLGSTLPAAGYFVVYDGPGTSVTVTNILPGTRYNAAVYSFSGSGTSIVYNHTPPTASVAVPLNKIYAQASVQGPDVLIQFSANPGEWYWLQYSDSLNPPNWQNVLPGPTLFTNLTMTLVDPGGATGPQRFYRLQQMDPLFSLRLNAGAVTSLQRTGDPFATQFLQGGGRLGDAIIKYRQSSDPAWHTFQSSAPSGVATVTYSTSADGTQQTARYQITNSLPGTLVFESVFTFRQDTLLWSLNVTNLTGQTVLLGDLALPLPMNMAYSGVTSSAMKHSFISGYGSFIFWMRPNSVGPYLLLTPSDNTKLEFWDDPSPPLGYRAYIHSYVAGTNAAAQYPAVTTQGSRWRQPNTSLTLTSNGSQTYGFKFQWANDYGDVRQALVDEGKVDVHVVPGMTVPNNLFAQFALRTTQTVSSVSAEFPAQTQIQFLGTTNVPSSGTYQLYQVQFSQLGENELTIQYGSGRTMYLEFFVTEPLETLINKRSAFLVSKQINDPTKWYNSLFCDWNMNDQVLITPDNHDTLDSSFQVYEIASDDAGESRPAYMGEKEAVFPLQSEVTALDNYIQNFVWGGLQRATNETSAYGIYGVPDWHNLRTNNNLSLGRGYDYPHIFVMYYGMYRVAKYHPEVTTYLTAQNYLQRAWGTAMALWTFGGGQATHVGLMNEVVIPDIIDALQAEGMTSQATSLRNNWEQKVNYYVTGRADLFASEYAFDSTGFESQEAYAKYALQHAGSSVFMGSTNVALFLQQARQYALTQITANMFDRGWLETAYYFYGSDYRGDMGDDYIVTYMAQEGGWGLLDFALYYATNATDYLRLGYGSYLNGWSTFNSGTPASNYGFWYPGAANDGGCGGGFEPSPYNTTWLGGQPMHRGAWYYSAEENLGYCGAIRSGATILADDPIFGRFCYGGSWQLSGGTNQVVPLDGVRKRFHAMLNNSTLHMVLNGDRFAVSQPLALKDDLSLVSFQVESGNPTAHNELLRLTVSVSGQYTISNNHGVVTTLSLVAGQETQVSLPVDAAAAGQPFTITR
jgi:hypothetical protein